MALFGKEFLRPCQSQSTHFNMLNENRGDAPWANERQAGKGDVA